MRKKLLFVTLSVAVLLGYVNAQAQDNEEVEMDVEEMINSQIGEPAPMAQNTLAA